MDVLIGEDKSSSTISYEKLKDLCLITSDKVDRLREELKNMVQVVKTLVDEIAVKGFKTKTTGGRTAVSFDYHLWYV